MSGEAVPDRLKHRQIGQFHRLVALADGEVDETLPRRAGARPSATRVVLQASRPEGLRFPTQRLAFATARKEAHPPLSEHGRKAAFCAEAVRIRCTRFALAVLEVATSWTILDSAFSGTF